MILEDFDVAFIGRYIEPEAVELARRLSVAGMGIVWDYDDDVVRPSDAPASTAWREVVDVITTTNDVLAERYREYGARTVMPIPNFITRPSLVAPRRKHEGTVVGYIGWIDHQDDWDHLRLQEIAEDLLEIHPDLRIESVGPIDLRLPTDRYHSYGVLNFDQLPQAIAGFDIALAPLIDKLGNATRSDIKLKEYAIAGVPWLASDYGPYVDYGEDQGGRLVADDGWFDALHGLLSDGKAQRKLAKRGQKWAKDQTLRRTRRCGRARLSRRSSWPRSAAGRARPSGSSGRSARRAGAAGSARRVRAAAGRQQLADGAAAAGTRLAGAAVHEEAILERAARAVEVAEVVDRRAVRVDPLLQRLAHGVAQQRPLGARESACLAQRVDLSAEEGLVRVDVADARDPLLVEQERLHRRPRAACERVQVLACEVVGERLDAEPRAEIRVELGPAGEQPAGAEAARVDEAERVLVVEAHDRARVGRARLGVVEQVAGHPQVHQQEQLVFELGDQVLAATVEALDVPADERAEHLVGLARRRPARVAHAIDHEHPSLQPRRELAADRLDLGQLGHGEEASERARTRLGRR